MMSCVSGYNLIYYKTGTLYIIVQSKYQLSTFISSMACNMHMTYHA